jgi:hypothetical protein
MVSMCSSVLFFRTYSFQLALVACFKVSSLGGGPQKVSYLGFEPSSCTVFFTDLIIWDPCCAGIF